jgi:hypothetical protein
MPSIVAEHGKLIWLCNLLQGKQAPTIHGGFKADLKRASIHCAEVISRMKMWIIASAQAMLENRVEYFPAHLANA